MRTMLVLGTAAVLGAAAAALAGDPPVRVHGVVKEVAKDGASFSLEEKASYFDLEWEAETLHFVYEEITWLKDSKGQGHVLGRRQKGSGPGARDRIVDVQAIVAGDAFQPPEVSADLRAKGIAWVSGPLALQDYFSHSNFTVAGVEVDAPAKGRVIQVRKGAKTDVKKGALVYVEAAPGPDPKAKRRRAKKVSIVGEGIAAAEQKLLFGP